jgi:hypothetical protein
MMTRFCFESFPADAAGLFGYRGYSYFRPERSRILA